MRKGVDYPGIGVGAFIFDEGGRLLLMRRGKEVRNEAGHWDMPGGGVRFNERRTAAVVREVAEELGVRIQVQRELLAVDHIIRAEGQHWVTAPFVVRIISGRPRIMEPHKCDEIGFFHLNALPRPLATSTVACLKVYRRSSNR